MLHFLEGLTGGMEAALELAVPLIASMAELIGLFIIVVSLLRTTYHYVRVMLFHDNFDYHLEMSAGLVTALEFLMAAEVSKTILLPTLDTVLLLVATFVSRALMNILLRVEMRSARAEHAEAMQDEAFLARQRKQQARRFVWPWRQVQEPAAPEHGPAGQDPKDNSEP